MTVMSNLSRKCSVGSKGGFTLIELLVVIVVIGILLSVILPRAHRASVDAKFAMIRQHASELGSHIVQWGQDKVFVQHEASQFTLIDVLTEEITFDRAAASGFTSQPLVDRYTGNDAYKQVSALVSGDFQLTNPFNNRSYFNPANDDVDNQGNAIAPSIKPGLLYLASETDKSGDGRNLRDFYLVITGQPDGNTPRWYGQMNTEGEGLRHGIFVVKVPEMQTGF